MPPSREWQGGTDLLKETTQTVKFDSLDVPADTAAVMEYNIGYQVHQIEITDGRGKTSKLDLIKKQSFSDAGSFRHDLTRQNAKTAWPALKAKVLAADPSMRSQLIGLEDEMKKHGWLT